ncbi:MAG: DNA adenine methylase [Rhodocyclaceae bacterium]
MESSHTLDYVEPIRPIAPYIGGKRNLAQRLVKVIESVPHATYAEPFVGMGGVFFRRSLRPKGEVINDLSGDVTTLFRVLQRHYGFFMQMLRFELTTRKGFARLMKTEPDTLTDLERAARFLYLQRTGFGGKVHGRSFGVQLAAPARFSVTRIESLLEEAHERLSDVVIECLPWEQFIERYDRPATLFYLDPPYWGCESDYGKGMFGREEFERMADVLAGIKGRFILSLNDRPEVRKVFRRFNQERVETTYTVGGAAKAQRVGELVISNIRRSRR